MISAGNSSPAPPDAARSKRKNTGFFVSGFFNRLLRSIFAYYRSQDPITPPSCRSLDHQVRGDEGRESIPAKLDIIPISEFLALGAATVFVGYLGFHYVLFLLATNPKRADAKGHRLNEFEERQLVDWKPGDSDFLKHDDEQRSYDDAFGPEFGVLGSYNSCTFPRTPFSNPYEGDFVLLDLENGMRVLDLGCGSGAAAEYFARRKKVNLLCVTNAETQAAICRKRLEAVSDSSRVEVADFDKLELPENSFDAIYSIESVGYTKDLDRWLANCYQALKPGGRLLIRTPASLENCRHPRDYQNVTAFFENWRYNFFGANLLTYKMRQAGFESIRYRQLPFWAWGLTWNFIRQVIRWKFRLRMRTMVSMERIIWQTSKAFVFGNAYNIVIAHKPTPSLAANAGRDSFEASAGFDHPAAGNRAARNPDGPVTPFPITPDSSDSGA